MFVRAIATGEITPEEIHEYIREVAQDERVKPGFRELFDVRHISRSQVTPESFTHIRQLAKDNPKRLPGTRLAIVVSSGNSFDKARKYEALASPDLENVIVFNDLQTAEIWLGVRHTDTE
jgi:hypothetical protein